MKIVKSLLWPDKLQKIKSPNFLLMGSILIYQKSEISLEVFNSI